MPSFPTLLHGCFLKLVSTLCTSSLHASTKDTLVYILSRSIKGRSTCNEEQHGYKHIAIHQDCIYRQGDRHYGCNNIYNKSKAFYSAKVSCANICLHAYDSEVRYYHTFTV